VTSGPKSSVIASWNKRHLSQKVNDYLSIEKAESSSKEDSISFK
jgi:hypothetical protein